MYIKLTISVQFEGNLCVGIAFGLRIICTTGVQPSMNSNENWLLRDRG